MVNVFDHFGKLDQIQDAVPVLIVRVKNELNPQISQLDLLADL